MRYDKRKILRNNRLEFEDLFKNRSVDHILHHETAILRYPSSAELGKLSTAHHTWKRGDRLFKLAHRYYGDVDLWWVIGWFNQKPTDAHIKIGDSLEIPININDILRYLGV